MLHQSGQRHFWVDIDHEQCREITSARLHEQRHVEHHHVVGVDLGRETNGDLCRYRRMNDRVQVGQRRGIGEDEIGDRLPIEPAIGGDDLRSEPFDHGLEHRSTGGLHLADDGIGIDEYRSLVDESGRHRRLPRTDATRETDELHVRHRRAPPGGCRTHRSAPTRILSAMATGLAAVARSDDPESGHTDVAVTRSKRDQVLAFRPVILAIRGGSTALSVGLAGPAFASQDWPVIFCCALVVAYNVFRIVQPIRYFDDTASIARVLVDVTFHVLILVATGFWESPFVFSLISAITIAGFARGFAFALRVSIVASLAISIPFLAYHEITPTDLRTTTQWSVWLMLVALIAGYARRIIGEADRQHGLALDRLGRLADANLLLYSLHRVAQTLPASLDLEESLDTTMHRLKDLFQCDGLVLLLLDEPLPLQQAVKLRRPVAADQLLIDGPGLSAEMESGLYAALPARDSTVGVIALEHREQRHFSLRDQELLDGFVEPAALAIDNARWFARLRTVGADEERTRIARDLHDRIGQSLAYLAFELDRIIKVDAKNDPVGPHLKNLRTDVRSVVSEVRDTLYDLRTDVTDTQDISDILEGFLDRVASRSGLITKLNTQVSGRLPLMQERELWRIAQEAITNVERHANASKVAVTWHSDGSRALLLVADDGIGLPQGQAGRLDSYGVLGMRERAASIGARMDLAGVAGKGTTVRCEITPS